MSSWSSGCGGIVVIEDADFVEVDDCGTPGPPGPQGPPGPGGASLTVFAGETIAAWRAVIIKPDGFAYLADADVTASAEQVVGISMIAGLAGEPINVAMDGFVVDTSPVVWTPGQLFVGDDGVLISGTGGGEYDLWIATALTITQLLIRPQYPIFLVA